MKTAQLRRLGPSVVRWIVFVSLWAADSSIQLMLMTRTNERRVRPTLRIKWPPWVRPHLMRQSNNTCAYCGHRITARGLHVDHMVPVVRGGSNDINNLQAICRPCNKRKGQQTDEEFRERYRRLVPLRSRTPPRRRISQREFNEETRRTEQSESVRQFRRTRFISKRSKMSSGCLALGVVVFTIIVIPLAQLGAEGWLLLLPPLALGGGSGLGVWARAYGTGAMVEDE